MVEKLRKLKRAHKAKRLLEEAPIKGLKFCNQSCTLFTSALPQWNSQESKSGFLFDGRNMSVARIGAGGGVIITF